MKVRFGIFADLHIDFIHDSVARFDCFLSECEKEKVDFCVQLGDFCPPNGVNTDHKDYILRRISESKIPFYHVLGNHDMDENSKEEVLDYIGTADSHNSFDCGGVHFIVLDACYYQEESSYFAYENGNYKKASPNAKVPVLPPTELEWLKKDLDNAKYPSVIFTHQSLIESRAGIRNASEFRQVGAEAPKGVLLAVCGHEHVDRMECKEGIWYLCLNGMSYYWAGSKYKHDTYSKDVTEKYPKLERIFPYRDPLYAIIEINDDTIHVQGTATEFVGATPEQMRFEQEGLTDRITTSIIDRKVKI